MIAVVKETVWVDLYEADQVLTAQMFPDGSGILQLRGGRDKHGPVKVAQYARVERIIRRPLEKEKP